MPDDSAYSRQFLLAHDILTDAGFEHYELSNYAKKGFRSKHNAAYWKGEPYLGIGPSAHSYNGIQRLANVASNPKYIEALKENRLAVIETENLSFEQKYNEYILTQLRKAEGIDLDFLEKNWNINILQKYKPLISSFQANGDMLQTGNMLHLSPQGWLISDYIIRELMWED
jgi:oxygen-independent coproporphyrinogen-3 oxidase